MATSYASGVRSIPLGLLRRAPRPPLSFALPLRSTSRLADSRAVCRRRHTQNEPAPNPCFVATTPSRTRARRSVRSAMPCAAAACVTSTCLIGPFASISLRNRSASAPGGGIEGVTRGLLRGPNRGLAAGSVPRTGRLASLQTGRTLAALLALQKYAPVALTHAEVVFPGNEAGEALKHRGFDSPRA